MLIQTLGGHNITVLELRNYFELMRSNDYPIELLDTLITMAKREFTTPSYHIDFSKKYVRFARCCFAGIIARGALCIAMPYALYMARISGERFIVKW